MMFKGKNNQGKSEVTVSEKITQEEKYFLDIFRKITRGFKGKSRKQILAILRSELAPLELLAEVFRLDKQELTIGQIADRLCIAQTNVSSIFNKLIKLDLRKPRKRGRKLGQTAEVGKLK